MTYIEGVGFINDGKDRTVSITEETEEGRCKPRVGWTCPVCGTGVAPWMPTCPCRKRTTVAPDPAQWEVRYTCAS